MPFLIITATLLLITKLLKVKPEDQTLIDKLKEQKINTWTLVPEDKRKWIFVPFFSLTFILLSLLVLKYVETSNAQDVYFNEDVFIPSTPTQIPWPTYLPPVRYPTPFPIPSISMEFKNGSFEQWSQALPDHWSLLPGSQVNKSLYHTDGVNAIEFPPERAKTLLISDSVRIRGNETLETRLWYRTQSVCTDCAFVGFQFFDREGIEIKSNIVNCGSYNPYEKMWSVYIQGAAPNGSYFNTECAAPFNAWTYKLKIGIWNQSDSEWDFDEISVFPKSTLSYPNTTSTSESCPTALQNGMCNLPNCSYSYPNDIYTRGKIIVGDAFRIKYGRPSGTFYDACTEDNTQVIEQVCSATTEGNYGEGGAIYDCPLGCRDGACIE